MQSKLVLLITAMFFNSITSYSQFQQEELVVKMIYEVGRVIETADLNVSDVAMTSTDQTFTLKGDCAFVGISGAKFTSLFDVTGRIKSFYIELPMITDKSKWNTLMNNNSWTSFFLPDDVKNSMALSKYIINFSNTASVDDIGAEFSLTENALSVFGIRDLKLSSLKIGYKIENPTTAPSLSGKIGGSASWGNITVAMESNLVTKPKDWEISFALTNLTFNDIVTKFSITQDLVIPPSVNNLLKIDYAKITIKPASYSFVFDGGSPLGAVNFVVKRVTIEGKPIATDTTATNTSLTGAYATTEVKVPSGSGPSNNVTVSATEHKWGIMAGFQLPQSNNAIPAIQTMRDIGLTNIGVVASTFDDNVETSLPIFSNLGTGNTTISKGFTFLAWIPVNELLNKHKLMKPLKAFAPAFITALQSSNPVQNVMFRANLPVDIANFSLEGNINFNDNMQLIPTTDIIVLKQLKLMMTPMAGAPLFSFGAGWEMKIDPTRKEPLKFNADILVRPTALTLGLSGAMPSSWDNPYGMLGLGINSPKIQASLNFSQDGIPIPDDLFFSGQLQYGKIVGDVTLGINYNEFNKNMVVARTCNLSLKNVLDQWLGGLVKTEFDKKKSPYLALLDDALNVEFIDAYIKVVPPQAPTSLMNGLRMENDYTKNCTSTLKLGNTWLPGVRIAAEGKFAGWHGMFDIGAEGNLTALQGGVTLKGMLDPIKLSAKGFKIFHLSGANSDADPFELYFDLSTNNIIEGISGFIPAEKGNTPPPGKIFYLSGKTTILEAAQGKALIELTTQGYQLQVKGKIYKFLNGTIDATIKDFKDILTNTHVAAKINVGELQKQVVDELARQLNNLPLFNEISGGFELQSLEFSGALAGLQTGADATMKFKIAGKTYSPAVRLQMDGNVKDLAVLMANKIKVVAGDGIAAAKRIIDDGIALGKKTVDEGKVIANKALKDANDTKKSAQDEMNGLKNKLSSAAPAVINGYKDGINTLKNKSLNTAIEFGNFSQKTVINLYKKSTNQLENAWKNFKNIFQHKDNEELILVNGPAFRIVTKFNGYVLKSPPNAARKSNIFMMPPQNKQDEMWQLVPNDKDGMFYMVSAYSGLLAAEPDHNINLIPHESDHKGRERMMMEPVPNEPGWFYMKYHGSGYYLAMSGTGPNSKLLAVRDRVTNDQGKFRFEKTGDVVWESRKAFPSQLTPVVPFIENNRYQVAGQPEQYRYNNGLFRWIPDWETLNALKLGNKPLGIINFDRQIGIPIGLPLPSLKDGALVQAQNEPAKYIIEKGTRRWIPDYETFTMMALREDMVQYISKADLLEIPQGEPIPSKFIVPSPMQEKLLYNTAGDPKVHIMLNRTLRHVPDQETLFALGYDVNMVQNVSNQQLATVPIGKPLPSRRDNTLLQAINEPAVYIMQFGVRRWIQDGETFNYMKLDWGRIQKIDKKDLTDIPEGPAITSVR